MEARDKLNLELENIANEMDFLNIYVSKSNLDETEKRAVALSLSAIYNGIEKILVVLHNDMAIDVPSGYNWHRELLISATVANIVSEELAIELSSFLSFRHFIRHAYSFEVEGDTILGVLKKLPTLLDRFEAEILDP